MLLSRELFFTEKNLGSFGTTPRNTIICKKWVRFINFKLFDII